MEPYVIFTLLAEHRREDEAIPGRRVSEQGLLKQKQFSDSKNQPAIDQSESDFGLTLKLDEDRATSTAARSVGINNYSFEPPPADRALISPTVVATSLNVEESRNAAGKVRSKSACIDIGAVVEAALQSQPKSTKMSSSGKKVAKGDGLAKKSLICLTEANFLRKGCIKIVNWK